ncbi:uncharacterized protein ISCGN_000969 [Ixodes scapularis]
MARMGFFGLMAAIVLLSPLCNGSGPPYPELNPALGKYQNALMCLPIDELWHSVYRNYEYDPIFGGTALCGTYSSLGSEEKGSFPMKIQFRHWSVKGLHTPGSRERPGKRSRVLPVRLRPSLRDWAEVLHLHQTTLFKMTDQTEASVA